MSFWMDNAAHHDLHTLLDLGYLKEQATRDRADQLISFGIGYSNFEIVGFGRLIVRLPPTKVGKVLQHFPSINRDKTQGYAWCTHSWLN